MSLQVNIDALIVRIADEFKNVRAATGSTADLTTASKTLVSAINELKTSIAAATSVDDAVTGTSTTYSSAKIVDLIAAATSVDDAVTDGSTTYSSTKIVDLLTTLEGKIKSDIIGGADAAYDTLLELQTSLQNDDTQIAAILAALGNRLRFDAPQELDGVQQQYARDNIDVYSKAEIAENLGTALGNRLRFDESQALDGYQQKYARDNIDVYSKAEIAENIGTALGNRLRFDEPQALDVVQQQYARDNIDVYSKAEIGDVAENLVTAFETAVGTGAGLDVSAPTAPRVGFTRVVSDGNAITLDLDAGTGRFYCDLTENITAVTVKYTKAFGAGDVAPFFQILFKQNATQAYTVALPATFASLVGDWAMTTSLEKAAMIEGVSYDDGSNWYITFAKAN